MRQVRQRKNIGFLYYLLFLMAIFIFGFYLFYLQATQQISADVILHLNFINPIISGKLSIPHEGFEYSVYLLASLFKSNYSIASAIFLSAILAIIAAIKFFLLKQFATSRTYLAGIFTLGLMFVSAICVPMFNSNLYLGQGSPTVWHNPTLLCTKPFAFLCVYLSVLALETFKHKIWFLLALLLFASFFYKPSLGIVFIPALFLYILCKHTRDLRSYVYFFLIILPSLIFAVGVQLRSWLFLADDNSIIFAPFGVLHLYTPNAMLSFILATAFPLCFMLIQPRRVLANRYLLLSWFMLIIGYLQFALLAETKCFYCANFSWGFLIALDLVFVFSFIEFITYLKEANFKNLAPSLLILLFMTHLFSGIGYLGRYLWTGCYF